MPQFYQCPRMLDLIPWTLKHILIIHLHKWLIQSTEAPHAVHPPQHWGGYPPTSHGVGISLAPAQLPYPSVSYRVHPQHWGGYLPASQGVGVPLAPAQLSYPSAPSSAHPFYNYHHPQGLGQQAPAPPVYPATSPWVQTYHPHTQQGLGQQLPVVAAAESAVKRGKRKAVDSDDAPPSKRQAIQPRVDDFNIIPINGSISRGGSSNIGGSLSKTQEDAFAQVSCEASTSNSPLEFFADSFEDNDLTSSGPLEEPVKNLDQAELAWAEEVKEFFDIIKKSCQCCFGQDISVVAASSLLVVTYCTSEYQLEVLPDLYHYTSQSEKGFQHMNSLAGSGLVFMIKLKVIIPSRLRSIRPDIMPLLTFDSTGERLRFLTIHRLDPCRSLEYCPALKTSIYVTVSPTNSDICPFLPRTLRRLALSEMLLSPSDRFVAYILDENARNLLHLAVALKHDAYLAFITEPCKDAGVPLT
ncbi:hypothetical protein EDD22DRAFT_1010689 [Suillus occidentalis]|nr:hypothetical protein EDD22DRAFT_1010689 [Suillus occidentalis]